MDGQGGQEGEAKVNVSLTPKTKDVKAKNAARCCRILLLATRRGATRLAVACSGFLFA